MLPIRSIQSAVLITSVICGAEVVRAQADVEPFLREGRLADGAAAMQQVLEDNPEDAEARFSLGIVQFLQAIEGLGQDQYQYGLLAGRARAMPFMRLPIGENPAPEEISYEKARSILTDFQDRLQTAEQTLVKVDPDGVKVPLSVALIHLDLDGNGSVTDQESLAYIIQTIQQPQRRSQQQVEQVPELKVSFDDADAVWLRGYCHVLLAMSDVVLAYDWQDQFERTAHLFYPNVDSPYDFLAAEGTGAFMSFGAQHFVDVIAWVHTINYELVEPDRMQSALAHMETVIDLSRKNWELIQAETDNDSEWVPNPDQTAALPGLRVGREVVTGWHEFLDEMEAILQGKKLVPFWRGIKGGVTPFDQRFPRNPTVGLNVRKMFTEPTRFDLALWLQGTALTPYLEEGDIVDPEQWQSMMSQFQGQFFSFALWFN